jgi:SagB-type dehydrogenase family enzyme
MPKLLWVALPLLLAAAALALAWWRARLPSRPVLNALLSLLLLAYLMGTAALGLFWVAAQQLPVFDWHYLFGYATVLLVAVHLVFNLRAAWRVLWRPSASAGRVPAAVPARRPLLAALMGAVAAGGLGFWFGRRQGQGDVAWDGAPQAEALASPVGRAGADGGGGAADAALALVERYHAMSSHARQRLWQQAPAVAWGAAPPPYKPWRPGAARVALPPASGAAAAPGLAALGTLLWHGAGITAKRGGLALRASPSSGGLFSTELYVIARRLPGLAPGAWHYRPEAQALLRVGDALSSGPGANQVENGAGKLVDDLADDRADDLAGDSNALLVATAVFRRTGHKYRDRCYRYVLADLGHALENLRVASASLRWPAVLLSRFDEARLAAALSIADESEEGVLAVMRLGAAGATAPSDATAKATPSTAPNAASPAADAAATPADNAAASGVSPGGAPPRRFGPVAAPGPAASRPLALGATAALHRAGSLRMLPAASAAAARSGGEAVAGAEAHPLPRVTPASADPLATIARRRSLRRFAASPLPLPALSAVLQALMLDRPALLSRAVRADVVANAVDDLAPGAYRYRPQDHALLPRRFGDLRATARAAALDQDVIGDAAAVLVLSIDRAAFAADAGGAARGYRHAFLEAGLVGERIYLEAGARGLGACAVGAFYDDEAAALVALDPSREWVVHFAALGRASP